MFPPAKYLQFASFLLLLLLLLLPATTPAPLPPPPPASSPASNHLTLTPTPPNEKPTLPYLTLLLPPLNTTSTTTPPNPNPSTPYKTFPPAPFTLPLPLTQPPQVLKMVKTYRAGLSVEKYALQDLITEQEEYYRKNPNPLPFHRTSADVTFSMRVPPPPFPPLPRRKITRSVAEGALRVFYALVEEYGAVECDFLVGDEEEGGGGGKAEFQVRFLDGG